VLCCVVATAVAGCSASSGRRTGHGGAPHRPLLVAALGDSITAGSPGYEPNPRLRRRLGLGDDPRSQYEYWAQRADRRLRFRNCGVPGQTAAQIGARMTSCARGADALVVQGGINDVADSLDQPRPLRRIAVSEAAATLGQIVEQGKRMGLKVAIANVLPWKQGGGAAAPLIDRLNRLIAALARVERAPLLRFNEALADPADPSLMRPRLTADGAHPSVAGYRRLGAVVAAAFAAGRGESGGKGS